MQLEVTRDSVAAGDDIETHDERVEVDERRPVGLVVESIVASGYLPRIAGGKATWLVRAGRRGTPLAVVAQEWARAELLLADDAEIGDLGGRLHFEYDAQEPPDEVLARNGGRRSR